MPSALLDRPMTTTPRISIPGNELGQVLSFVNTKGGVGKSTISAHVASLLHKRGYRVRFVDCDKQASSSTWLADTKTTMNVRRMETENDIYTGLRGLCSGGVNVIADGPAGDEGITRALMMRADLVVMPCGPSLMEMRPLVETLKLLEQVRMTRDGKPPGIIAPNGLKQGEVLTREFMEELGGYGLPILPSLSKREAFKDAVGQHTMVSGIPNRGGRKAAEEVELLVDALITHLAKPPAANSVP